MKIIKEVKKVTYAVNLVQASNCLEGGKGEGRGEEGVWSDLLQKLIFIGKISDSTT